MNFMVVVLAAVCIGAVEGDTKLATRGNDVKQISTGEKHTCAVLVDGSLFCWGDNALGQCGSKNTKSNFRGVSTAALSQFSQVDLGSNNLAKQVVTGGSHTCVLFDNDKIKCFGSNSAGQLGIQENSAGGNNVQDVGDDLPYVNVGLKNRVKQISAGHQHTCVILDTNTVKCFGSNDSGQLGLGERLTSTLNEDVAKLSVVDLGSNRAAKAIATGDHHTCVLLDNNQVKCFGSNKFGQLGLGDPFTRGLDRHEMGENLLFVNVGTNRTVRQVSASGNHTCVLLDNYEVKCFGRNDVGQLGLGVTRNIGVYANETGDSLESVEIGQERIVTQLSTGRSHTCVLLNNAQIKCFGKNNVGQLGLGDSNNRGDQKYEMGDNLTHVDLGTGETVKQVVSGFDHTCALLGNNRTKCFGANSFGQLGLGDIRDRGEIENEMGDFLPFIEVGFGRKVKQVVVGSFHICALLDNDQIKCFGRNEAGQVGLGFGVYDMGDSLTFVPVGSGRKVRYVTSSGFHTCVLLDNQQIKCFGYNFDGQLGLGDKANRGAGLDPSGDNLPYVDLGSNLRVLQVAAGIIHTCVLLDNHQVKCFGYNGDGQLGLGDQEKRGDDPGEMGDNLPFVNVGNNRTVKQIAVGHSHTCVLLDDNTVKCFGCNDEGQLGLEGTHNRGDDAGEMGGNLSSVDVDLNRTVLQVAAGEFHTCLLLDNHQVKCFGRNNEGQLGFGDPSLPYVDVGQNRAVKQVTGGYRHTCVLLDNDQVKCFGYNAFGQLGLGKYHDRGTNSSYMGNRLPFVDVGPNRSVQQVVAGGSHTCVLLDNDHIKCFGYNGNRELGLGDAKPRNSPPSLPVSFGFGTVSLPGSKLSSSKIFTSLCQVGEYQPLNNQQSCWECPVGLYQDGIGSTSCTPCSPGTYGHRNGTSRCASCLPGTYQDEDSSTQCKSCPPQRTTLGGGERDSDACVAAPGFMLLSTNEIQSCKAIVGADCSNPGTTLEQLPLECGYWRPNPITTELIQECSGGCESCHGEDVGDWLIHQFEYTTMYCADGYRGPRCTLCAEGFANVFRNDTCIECDDSNVLLAHNALRTEIVVWSIGLLFATFAFTLGLWLSNKRQYKKQSYQSVADIKAKRWLYLSWFGIVHSAGSVTMIAISFYQVFNAYAEEFRELDNVFDFDIDPFENVFMTHGCVWNPGYQERLMVHASVPLCLGAWTIIIGKLVNMYYQDQDVRDKNSSVAAFVALLPAILAYPSVQRRAVSVIVCEEFVIGPAANSTVRLLVPDFRQYCDSPGHFISEVLAVVCIVLYTILVVGVFAVAALFSDPDSNQMLQKWFRFSLLRRLLVSPFRVSNKTGHTLAWFLAYDTLRKFCQASLIVFFGRGTRLQVASSILLNFAALAVAYKFVPYRLDGTNKALLIQLYLLSLVCVVVASSEISVPLKGVREVLVIIVAGALVPLMAITCWIHNLWTLEVSLRQVQHAIEIDSEKEIKFAYNQAINLGLKPSHESMLRVAESIMRSSSIQERSKSSRIPGVSTADDVKVNGQESEQPIARRSGDIQVV